MRQKKRSRGEIIRIIAIIVCAVIFVCCAVYLIMLGVEAHRQKQDSADAVDRFVTSESADSIETVPIETVPVESGDSSTEAEVYPYDYIDFDALKEESPYVVGWIQIPAIEVIDYPIVQYTDNSYFLTHSWDAQNIRYGAIFLDYTNAPDLSDSYSLIYGHFMKNGTMFGSLKEYQDESFYQENGGTVLIYLPHETRVYEIFSVRVVSPTEAGAYTIGFTAGDSFLKYIQAMAEDSAYDIDVSLAGTDHVLTLSTCSGSDRLVVHSKLVKTYILPD